MESNNSAPRWTPSPSPTRSPLNVQLAVPPSFPFSSGAATPRAEGVSVAWREVGVSVKNKTIVEGLSGYAVAGEVLAIMGPSGSGKSTLLDALSGRLGPTTTRSGDIFINGRKERRLGYGTSAYVAQDDVLLTTLTAREGAHYSALLQLPDGMSAAEKRERGEWSLREMGLQSAGNTPIKRLSGGQKRRLSICMEIVRRPKLLFLDEPTSGLDSAAAYHVMTRIAAIAVRDRTTVIASIHQPTSDVFHLFHNLCLLSSGKTVYFGPLSSAHQFFASNGFPCPTLMNPSDHYLRTINKDFDVDVEQGGIGGGKVSAEQAISTLVKSYASSGIHEQVKLRISELCEKEGERVEKGSQASIGRQCVVLSGRSFVNMYRDVGYYWLRLGIYVALCLCVGTIFYDVGHTAGSIQARGAMLMFVGAFLTFMAIGGFPSFVEDMKVFGRERQNGHYGVAAFVVANTVSSVPYLALISLLPGAIAYFLVGLQPEVERFACFAAVLFACMMVVESLMMVVASLVPDFLMGIITGAGIQGVMMLVGGFFRLPNDLPGPVWRYPTRYIAFHTYANQAFYKNEFQGLVLASLPGDAILSSIWQIDTHRSKWLDLAVLFAMALLYRILFFLILKALERRSSTRHPA